jgi:pSer/pThr/pTyr-binding forkhead associated (FHA) protein
VPLPPLATGDARLTVGRSSDCDVCLKQLPGTEAGVSRKHLALVRRADHWYVEPLSASSPTFLSGRQIAGEMPVSADDTIVVGMLRIRLEGQAAPVAPQPMAAAAPPPPRPESRPPAPAQPGTSPFCLLWRSHDGAVRRADLALGQVSVGKGAGNMVRIADASCSREHARLRVGQSNAWITDVGSTNGTTVGGTPVVEETELRVEETFRLGRVDAMLVPRERAVAIMAQKDPFGGGKPAFPTWLVGGMVALCVLAAVAYGAYRVLLHRQPAATTLAPPDSSSTEPRTPPVAPPEDPAGAPAVSSAWVQCERNILHLLDGDSPDRALKAFDEAVAKGIVPSGRLLWQPLLKLESEAYQFHRSAQTTLAQEEQRLAELCRTSDGIDKLYGADGFRKGATTCRSVGRTCKTLLQQYDTGRGATATEAVRKSMKMPQKLSQLATDSSAMATLLDSMQETGKAFAGESGAGVAKLLAQDGSLARLRQRAVKTCPKLEPWFGRISESADVVDSLWRWVSSKPDVGGLAKLRNYHKLADYKLELFDALPESCRSAQLRSRLKRNCASSDLLINQTQTLERWKQNPRDAKLLGDLVGGVLPDDKEAATDAILQAHLAAVRKEISAELSAIGNNIQGNDRAAYAELESLQALVGVAGALDGPGFDPAELQEKISAHMAKIEKNVREKCKTLHGQYYNAMANGRAAEAHQRLEEVARTALPKSRYHKWAAAMLEQDGGKPR